MIMMIVLSLRSRMHIWHHSEQNPPIQEILEGHGKASVHVELGNGGLDQPPQDEVHLRPSSQILVQPEPENSVYYLVMHLGNGQHGGKLGPHP
jgi:hypothetical protein